MAQPVSPGCETLGAEVVYVMQKEMAISLSDVLRRTGLAASGDPSDETVRRCAEIAGVPLKSGR